MKTVNEPGVQERMQPGSCLQEGLGTFLGPPNEGCTGSIPGQGTKGLCW